MLVGGWVSDTLIKRTGSASIGRKLPIVAGLLLASTIVGANYVDNDVLVIGIMSLAFFGQGMVNLGWTLISDVAPKQLVGLTGGVFNFVTNLAGITTPMVIGFIVASTGSFVGGIAFMGALALIGALAYVFVLGDVVRVTIAGGSRALTGERRPRGGGRRVPTESPDGQHMPDVGWRPREPGGNAARTRPGGRC